MKIAYVNFRKFVKLSFWQRSPLISEKNQTFFAQRRRPRLSRKVYFFSFFKKKKRRNNQPNLADYMYEFRHFKFYLIKMYTQVLTM